jgi:hypothetical protein
MAILNNGRNGGPPVGEKKRKEYFYRAETACIYQGEYVEAGKIISSGSDETPPHFEPLPTESET